MKRERSFVRTYLILLISLLVLCAGITVFIDPYFHYHAPLKTMTYKIDDPRFSNPGIADHFDSSGILAGTSMIADFSATEASALYDQTFIKLIFKGGSYKEIGDCVEHALTVNPQNTIVIRSLDITHLCDAPDAPYHGIYDEGYLYPYYMYDQSLISDASYLWNKGILIGVARNLFYTLRHTSPFSMDDYGINKYECGADLFADRLSPLDLSIPQNDLTDFDKNNLIANLNQNVLSSVIKHPEVTFVFFFPPYNAIFWKENYEKGVFEQVLQSMQYAIEQLLVYPNVHVFSFYEDYEITCNLDLHNPSAHYSPAVCSTILKYMKEGKYEITLNNYMTHFERIRDYYINLDYTTLAR